MSGKKDGTTYPPGEKILSEKVTDGASHFVKTIKPYALSIWSGFAGIALMTAGMYNVEIASFFMPQGETYFMPESLIRTLTYVPVGLAIVAWIIAIVSFSLKYAHQLKKTS